MSHTTGSTHCNSQSRTAAESSKKPADSDAERILWSWQSYFLSVCAMKPERSLPTAKVKTVQPTSSKQKRIRWQKQQDNVEEDGAHSALRQNLLFICVTLAPSCSLSWRYKSKNTCHKKILFIKDSKIKVENDLYICLFVWVALQVIHKTIGCLGLLTLFYI